MNHFKYNLEHDLRTTNRNYCMSIYGFSEITLYHLLFRQNIGYTRVYPEFINLVYKKMIMND